MNSQHNRGTVFWRCVFVVICVLNSSILVTGFPSSKAATVAPMKSRDLLLLNNTLGDSISPPGGFGCRFRRIGQARRVRSRDLYSATLHALLHYSLQDYSSAAETYSTHGTEPLGGVLVKAIPFLLPVATTLNAHLAWGLYRSIIAFNSPDNIRETLASVFVEGLQVADIEYLNLPQMRIATKPGPTSFTTLTSATALQMLSAVGDGSKAKGQAVGDTSGWRLRFALVTDGQLIRRETAYDAIAYAILWTSQFSESTPFKGTRILSVPGGSCVVRFVSYQDDPNKPMTLGFAATVARSIPVPLEDLGFQEAFILVVNDEGQTCGAIGLWAATSRPHGLLGVGPVDSVTSE
ncbi:MAG: hypothetical protein Q9197_004478 [Variospora fuerteventurae]